MDPYQLLGVSPEAGEEEIGQAYRVLRERFGPENNPGDLYAEIVMREIDSAYETVKSAAEEKKRESALPQGNNARRIQRYVDVVCCVDVSESMREHLDRIREEIKAFPARIMRLHEDRSIDRVALRMRLITFTDYLTGGQNPIQLSDFWELPDRQEEFFRAVDAGLKPRGGFGGLCCGYEALAFAMRSPWTAERYVYGRHIIMLWSYIAPRAPGLRHPNYPAEMVQSYEELTEWWEQMRRGYKTLALYVPEVEGWSRITRNWERMLMFPSNAGAEMDEETREDILYAMFAYDM